MRMAIESIPTLDDIPAGSRAPAWRDARSFAVPLPMTTALMGRTLRVRLTWAMSSALLKRTVIPSAAKDLVAHGRRPIAFQPRRGSPSACGLLRTAPWPVAYREEPGPPEAGSAAKRACLTSVFSASFPEEHGDSIPVPPPGGGTPDGSEQRGPGEIPRMPAPRHPVPSISFDCRTAAYLDSG